MHYCLQNKSADFRHTQSWLTTSHNNPTRKSAPYGTHSRITILARSFVEVVIQTAIELICKAAILHEKYCAANLQRFSNLAMVQLSLCSIDRLLFGIDSNIYILSCVTRIIYILSCVTRIVGAVGTWNVVHEKCVHALSTIS